MNLCALYFYLVITIFVNIGFSHKLPQNDIKHRNGEHLSGLKELADKICSEYDYDHIAITNKYVDDYLLNDWNNYITKNNIDPIALPPFDAAVNWHAHEGNVLLDHGWLQGLLTVKRHRNVIIKKNYPHVKINVPLTLKNLKGGYTYYGKVRHVQARGRVNGTSSDTKFTIDLDVHILNYKVALDDFKLINPGKVSADFDGNFRSHIPNVFIDTFFPALKTVFKSVIEEYVVDSLNAILEKHNSATCLLSENCDGTSTVN